MGHIWSEYQGRHCFWRRPLRCYTAMQLHQGGHVPSTRGKNCLKGGCNMLQLGALCTNSWTSSNLPFHRPSIPPTQDAMTGFGDPGMHRLHPANKAEKCNSWILKLCEPFTHHGLSGLGWLGRKVGQNRQ